MAIRLNTNCMGKRDGSKANNEWRYKRLSELKRKRLTSLLSQRVSVLSVNQESSSVQCKKKKKKKQDQD